MNYAARGYESMAEETIRKAIVVDAQFLAPYYYLALGQTGKDTVKAATYWRQLIEKVRLDPNRSFWIPYVEKRLAAGGSPG